MKTFDLSGYRTLRTENEPGGAMENFEGKRVLVTGASSGIGAGLAVEFARRGAVVGICARRQDRLEDVLHQCQAFSPESQMWVVDLADETAVDKLAVDFSNTFGGIDILVNNAGIPKRRHLTRLDNKTVDNVMRINYSSPVQLTLLLLPHMLAQNSGTIINVSSVAATLSPPGEAAYSASKAAMTVFSESMALDLWDTGINVLILYPGVVDTELFTLPDNDPMVADVEAIPVADAVAIVFDGLAQGALQVYAPTWFADIAVSKAKDPQAFIAGSAEYITGRQGD